MLAPPDSRVLTGGDKVDPPQGDPPRQPSRAELTEANAAMAARIAEMESLLAAKNAEPVAPARPVVSADAWTLLTKLLHNGKEYAVGDVVPFDPTAAPKGCDGLEEGVHFTRSRILRG